MRLLVALLAFAVPCLAHGAAAHDSVSAFLAVSGVNTNTPTIPNTTAGTYCMTFASTRTNATLAINSSDGSWTSLHYTAQANLSYGVWYRRMTGGDANPVLSGGSNGTYAYIACATGILASGSPLDVAISNTNNGSGTTGTAPGVTLATSGALVYSAFFGNNDTDPAFTGWSNALRSGGSPIERAEGGTYESMTGSDASMGLASEVIAATGATGDTTMDVGASITYQALMIALTPAAAGGSSVVSIVLQQH